MKKSFLIYIDSLDVLDDLTIEQTGELFKAIRDYQIEKEIELSGLMKAIFTPFRNQFERDNEKYLQKSEKNRENAHKRWDKPNANACERIKPNAKHADSVNDNDSDNVNDNGNERKEKKPPKQTKLKKEVFGEFKNVTLTLAEVEKLREKCNPDDVIEFFSSYKAEKGTKTKSDYLTITRWVINAVEENKQRGAIKTGKPKRANEPSDFSNLTEDDCKFT